MEYKVISLLQPWASLVVMGKKHFETRPRDTKHRGTILIHASAGKAGLQLIDKKDPFGELARTLKQENLHHYDFPLGAIIGQVDIIDTFPSEDAEKWLHEDALATINAAGSFTKRNSPIILKQLMDREQTFGDYAPGRKIYKLGYYKQFEHPIPAKGQLGIWTFQSDTPLI